MARHYQEDWNELARREPYFAVITDPRYLSGRLNKDARRHFFETGEDDVERLLAAVTRHVGKDFNPSEALDFGCGVGRLTIPLARRVPHVIGCDFSPAMVALAKQNAAEAGVHTVQFVSILEDVREQKFDLICSLLVFQHMPVSEGLSALSNLLELLAPGGVAALHFTLRRPGSPLRRVARRLRGRLPLLHQMASKLLGDELQLPYMQMNDYDEREIQRHINDVTGARALVVPRWEGDIQGAIFIAQRDGRSSRDRALQRAPIKNSTARNRRSDTSC